jgi:hypothetical protein
MDTTAFDHQELEQLRRLQHAYLPGNLLAAFGFPALVLVPVLLMCSVLPFIASGDKVGTTRPANQKAQQEDGGLEPIRKTSEVSETSEVWG